MFTNDSAPENQLTPRECVRTSFRAIKIFFRVQKSDLVPKIEISDFVHEWQKLRAKFILHTVVHSYIPSGDNTVQKVWCKIWPTIP